MLRSASTLQAWNRLAVATGALAVACGRAPDSPALGAPPKPPVPLRFTSITPDGNDHTCALAAGGHAYCWGDNWFGQLGDGSNQWRYSPVRVAGNRTFTQITAGHYHTCGIAVDSTVYCWGRNDWGQLGDGTTAHRNVPVRVLANDRFVSIDAGYGHTCGITATGTAYCWGLNHYGQLGNGMANGFEANPVPALVVGSHQFRLLTAGGDHTCALSTETAYCWGYGHSGQLGNGLFRDTNTVPIPVKDGKRFTAIAAGGYHTCALAGTDAYCWGGNWYAQLGNPSLPPERVLSFPEPVAVSGGHSFRTVTAYCGLTSQGHAYCWGDNGAGQLGVCSTSDTCFGRPCTTKPLLVPMERPVALLAGGTGTTCAITVDGVAYCWGFNQGGKLGDGTTISRCTPVKVLGQ